MGGNLDKPESSKQLDELPIHERLTSDLFGSTLDKLSEFGNNSEQKATAVLDSVVENSSVARKTVVAAEGLAYALPGFGKAAVHNLTNWGELAPKLVSAGLFGVGMRVLLPEEGAAKALVGTAYSLSFLREAWQPLKQAFREVDNGGNLNSIKDSAQRLGDGLGEFGVDSTIGIMGAKVAEGGSGWALKKGLGTEGYVKFETAKDKFFNSEKMPVGYILNHAARGADWAFGGLGSKLMKPKDVDVLPADAIQRVEQVTRTAQKSVEDEGFYKYGKKLNNGQRINFSEYVNRLEAGEDPHLSVDTTIGESSKLSLRSPGGKARVPDASPPSGETAARETTGLPEIPKPVGIVGPQDLAGGDGTDPEGIRAPKKPKPTEKSPEATEAPPRLVPVTGTVAHEYDVNTLTKMAKHAQGVMASWDDITTQLADYHDQWKTPIGSVADKGRKGALVSDAYQPSTSQLLKLVDAVQSKDDFDGAGMLIQHHAAAAMGIERGDPLTLDLNMLAAEYHGIFLKGLRDQGISDKVLSSVVPSLFAVTNDGGAGNFTEPSIPGVVNRPVTVWPRNQTGLAAVFSDINGHEVLGHDYVYQDLARFATNYRLGLVDDVLNQAATKEGLSAKTVQFGKKAAIAEANENTADFMNVVINGPNGATSLGVLLQSLREGGQLETRDVYGKRFALSPEDGGPAIGTDAGIEPHGIDRWRIKWMAEILRQLSLPADKVPAGPELAKSGAKQAIAQYDRASMTDTLQKFGDKDLLNKANALDNYGAQASRPGDSYIWANEDKPGEKITIPAAEWDAVIPYLVRAQLDTPLEALEGHTMRSILPNLVQRMRGVDLLAGQMSDSALSGNDKLTVPFDKTQFTIGQVFSAGHRAWMKAVASGADAGEAHAHIESISAALRAQYRQGNPHEVPLQQPFSQVVVRKPLTAMRTIGSNIADGTGRALMLQTAIREMSARYATPMAGAAASTMMNEIMQHRRLQAELEALHAQEEQK